MMSTYQRASSVVVGAAGVSASSPTPEATLDCSSPISSRSGPRTGKRLTRRGAAVLKNEIGGLFRQHYGGCVGIARGHVREGGRIDHAQARHPAHTQLRIKHRGARIATHGARAARVEHRACALAEVSEHLGIGLHGSARLVLA